MVGARQQWPSLLCPGALARAWASEGMKSNPFLTGLVLGIKPKSCSYPHGYHHFLALGKTIEVVFSFSRGYKGLERVGHSLSAALICVNPPALRDDPKSTRSLESKYPGFLGLGRTVQKQSIPPVIGTGGGTTEVLGMADTSGRRLGVTRILRDSE